MSDPILGYHQKRHRDWVDLLRQLVELESPTLEKGAVDKCGGFLKAELEAAGARVEVIPQEKYGNFLRAEIGTGEKQILVLCHFDTVWPVGQLKTMPCVEKDGSLWGPGVFDMKAGVMYTLAALKAIKELGLKPGKKLVLLYNTEEEMGSPNSRPYIEQEALRSDAVLVLEPSTPPTAGLKTSRKGVGMFNIKVEGRPSHAGGNPKGGISAVEEMARQVLKLHSLTDYEKGTYVNVGTINGGTRRNVVAAEASAEIDLRATTMAEADRAVKAILGLTPFHPEAKVTVTGGMNRPPMERTDAIVRIFEVARSMAAEMGFEVVESHTGGGSDGNFTAGLGIPTLDGLGAVGDGAHAYDEHTEIAPIPGRAALLTRLMVTL